MGRRLAPRNKSKSKKKQPSMMNEMGWLDHVEFVPSSFDSSKISLSVVSWNILAHAYCSRRSHAHLPASYQSVVFSDNRVKLIVHVLKERIVGTADVICLQEVDVDVVQTTLREAGYDGIETPRTKGGGAGGREDSCGIYVCSPWELIQHELIRLDDLATLSSATSKESCGESMNGNLQGLQQSFLRRNVALVVRLRHSESGRTVVVANAHLYWHPGYEYVKLCQAHYILLRAQAFRRPNEPFIFAGDFNSRPHGAAHSYLTTGHINAKQVAPWYCSDRLEEPVVDDLVGGLGNLTIERQPTEQKVRYLLDATLNKFCRWLRILGQDTALETEEEERQRTGKNKMILFERCRDEGRTLVTASNRLLLRKDCPPGTYCISPSFLASLEVVLIHMLLTHGVVLEPRTFLTRCVVCNGAIVEVKSLPEKRRILQEYQAPVELLDDDMDVFECDGCRQGYWWCDRPTSSASRVMEAATRLFRLSLRAGVPVWGDMGAFDHVDVEEERRIGWDYSLKGSELLERKLEVIEWLRAERLDAPLRLESAYAAKDDNGKIIGESLPFTNVTHGFVNTLDYVWFTPSSVEVNAKLHVPNSFSELNPNKIENGHLLPSRVWPSDHLAIGARFNYTFREPLAPSVEAEPLLHDFCAPDSDTVLPMLQSRPLLHSSSCACGCVPKIPSLFAMAELRKQAKLAGKSPN